MNKHWERNVKRQSIFIVFLVLNFVSTLNIGQVAAYGYTHAPGSVSMQDLPQEAKDTLELIRKGGPFPYAKDGTVFGNREKKLPLKPRGYYREYTVKTKASKDRGALRIVAGEAGEYFFTEDHYNSFRRIME